MNWAQQKRQEFIRDLLNLRGTINRADLMEEFGISIVSASHDLRSFLASEDARKLGVEYSHSRHRYETAHERLKVKLRENAGKGNSE